MNKIYSRSPYVVKVSKANLESVLVRILVYSGQQASSSGNVTDNGSGQYYEYTSTALSTGDDIYINIAEVVSDNLETNFDGTYSSDVKWVDYQLVITTSGNTITTESKVQLVAVEGYTYVTEGQNRHEDTQPIRPVLIPNDVIVADSDAKFRVPVWNEDTTKVDFIRDNEIVYTQSFSSSSTSSHQIKYVESNGDSSEGDTFQQRMLSEPSGVIEDSICSNKFFATIDIGRVDKVIVTASDGSSQTINVQSVEACKYEPIKLTFINRYGALQDIIFFKRSERSMEVEKESYSRSFALDYYNNGYTSRHQKNDMNITSMDSVTLNSGYYPEAYNEVFKEMMLSCAVWVYMDNKSYPVTIKDSEFLFKTSLNEKLINYTVNLEIAQNTINNIF